MLILCLTLLAEECIFLDAGSITTNGSILSEKSNSNKKNLFLPEEDREKVEGHLKSPVSPEHRPVLWTRPAVALLCLARSSTTPHGLTRIACDRAHTSMRTSPCAVPKGTISAQPTVGA